MTCPRKVFLRVILLFDLSHIDFSGSTSSRETSQCSLKRHSILTSHVNDSQFYIPGPDRSDPSRGADLPSAPGHQLKWTIGRKEERTSCGTCTALLHRIQQSLYKEQQLYPRWQTTLVPTTVSQDCPNTLHFTSPKKLLPSYLKEQLSLPMIHWEQNCRISNKAIRC